MVLTPAEITRLTIEEGFKVHTLQSDYTLRWFMKKPFYDETRFQTLVFPRRAGKTIYAINYLIEKALTYPDPSGVYMFIAPTRQTAKDAMWPLFKLYCRYLQNFRKDIVTFNENDLSITFINGGRILLKGMDKPDNLRGFKILGAVLDEFSDQDPYGWTAVVLPALSDSLGWARFTGTPRGRNHHYKHYMYGLDPEFPDWSSYLYKSSEIRHLKDHDNQIAMTKRIMSVTPGLFEQEYECSFNTAPVGAYYASLLTASQKEGMIGDYPYNPKYEVITAWDLGAKDFTSIWFAQRVERWLYVIDHHKVANQTNFKYFSDLLDNKGYKYSDHIIPFDAKMRKVGMAETFYEQMSNKYPGKIRQANTKAGGVLTGIQTVQALLPMVKWNEIPTEEGRSALFQYRAEYNESLGVQDQRPLHDWTSHDADSFRYLATNLKKTIADTQSQTIRRLTPLYNPLDEQTTKKYTDYSPFNPGKGIFKK